jgi:molybdopterin/thiamine biosynthesis adenylyltransferase
MAGKFHHEELYRSTESIVRLGDFRVTLCGAGALGSHLADNLVRQGFAQLRVIDRDRVEEHNINTQVYGEEDIGAWKTDVLRNRLFRNVGVEVDGVRKELNDRTARKLLNSSDIVIDTFDNSESRALLQNYCRSANVPCLHAGLFSDYGEVVWDTQYRIPRDVGQDVCDYPLARNLVLLTISVASETLVRFVLDGVQESWSITLCDFAVRPLAAAH